MFCRRVEAFERLAGGCAMTRSVVIGRRRVHLRERRRGGREAAEGRGSRASRRAIAYLMPAMANVIALGLSVSPRKLLLRQQRTASR